jgi:flagellar hook assembly protein FlgD
VFDRPADVVVTVTPYRTDDVLRTITGRTSDGNRYTLQWDGKDSAGAVLPDAPYYRVRITATAVGGTATWDDWYWFACVDNARRVGTITGPAAGTVLGAGSTMTVELTGMARARDLSSVAIEDVATGKVLGRTRSVYESTLELEVQPGVLPDGEHQLRARVGFWDEWGTERSHVGPAATYTVRTAATLSAEAERRYVWPEHGSWSLRVVEPAYTLEKTALLRGELLDGAGTVVRTVVPDTRMAPGTHRHTVDGRSGPEDQAPPLPSGVYTYRATATFDDGRTARHEVEVGIAHGVPQLQVDPGDEAVVTPTFSARVTEATGLPVQSAEMQMRGSGWYQPVGSADAGTTPRASLALPVDLRPLQTDDRIDGYVTGSVRDPFGLPAQPAGDPAAVRAGRSAARGHRRHLRCDDHEQRAAGVRRHVQPAGHRGVPPVLAVGSPPRQLGSEPLSAGATSTWTWDSRYADGNEAHEGEYYVDVVARTTGTTEPVVRRRSVSVVRVGGTLSVSGGVTDGKVRGVVTFVVRPPAGLAVTERSCTAAVPPPSPA